MAEIIDVLFIAWCLLALGAYILGQVFEKHLQSKKTPPGKDLRRPEATDLDNFWSAPQSRGSTSYYDQSPAYRQSRDLSASNYHSSAPSSAYANSTHQNYQQLQQYGSAYESSYPTAASSSNYHGLQSSYEAGGSHYDAAGSHEASGYYNRFEEADLSPHAVNAMLGSSHFETSSGSVPTATGFNIDSVEWVNSILCLFYTQPEKYGPIIGENVYRSLNEKLSNITSSSSEHANLMIEFQSINSELSTRPELTNIRTECESDKSISATCKIYNKRLNFTLLIKRLLQANERSTTSSNFMADDAPAMRYELVLENLEGKLKSVAMLADKLIVIQFIEKPDTKILLRPISSSGYGQANQQLISEDVLVQMILQTLTQVVVDLYFGNDVDFPQFAGKHAHGHQSAYANYKHKINTIKRSLKHDLFGSHSDSSKERKVFVKIICAKNINYNQSVTCLMELDAPKQQAVSSTKQGSNPFWDEHFLFHVNDKSRELTLELWDSLNLAAIEHTQASSPTSSLKRKQQLSLSANKTTSSSGTRWNKAELAPASAKFLGFARVSVDELRQNPVQKLSLSLQPALNTPPNDLSSSVGGELQLELLFLEHSSSGAVQSAGAALSGQQPLHKSNSLSSLAYQQGDIVSIDRKLTPSGFVITTTTITKQPQQQANKQQAGRNSDQLLVRNQSPAGSSSMATERSFDDMNLDGLSGSNVSAAVREQQLDRRSEGAGVGVESPAGGRLSRSRSRSRSLLRAIKKRFSFSRTRSRSVGGDSVGFGSGGASQPGTPATDRLEADFEAGSRSRASSDVSTGGLDASGRAKSVPASRDPCEVPTIVINKGRLSDTASAFTFTRPKSQLVIEVLEPTLREDGAGNNTNKGIYRYYAISDSAADKRKWRKRGTKLHLFNEHQFIANHMASSSTCHLCGRLFSRRPGKQGYKCRNCHLLLHKQCHVKVDHNCPYAKRDGLPLEYIDAEPPAGLVDEMMEANRRQQQQAIGDGSDLTLGNMGASRSDPYHTPRAGTSGRPASLRMSLKSISMEVDDR